MGFLDMIFGKKKKQRQRLALQQQVKQAEGQKQVTIVQQDPLVTLTTEVTAVRYAIQDLKRAMHEDHHKILSEFDHIPKHEDIKNILNDRTDRLKREKDRIEKEIELTELQKEIVECLDTPKSAAEVAEKLGKSRTWVSQQMTKLYENRLVESKKEGKSIRYYLPADTGQSTTAKPPEDGL